MTNVHRSTRLFIRDGADPRTCADEAAGRPAGRCRGWSAPRPMPSPLNFVDLRRRHRAVMEDFIATTKQKFSLGLGAVLVPRCSVAASTMTPGQMVPLRHRHRHTRGVLGTTSAAIDLNCADSRVEAGGVAGFSC